MAFRLGEGAMDAISSTASSSADIAADIVRLIAPADREGFHYMLQHELGGFHSPLPDDEMRRLISCNNRVTVLWIVIYITAFSSNSALKCPGAKRWRVEHLEQAAVPL
jgi:hypothetical protein